MAITLCQGSEGKETTKRSFVGAVSAKEQKQQEERRTTPAHHTGCVPQR